MLFKINVILDFEENKHHYSIPYLTNLSKENKFYFFKNGRYFVHF